MTQDTEDVVARLRDVRCTPKVNEWPAQPLKPFDLANEAADEIERLRSDRQSLSDRIDGLEGRGEAVTDEELLEDFARALCAHNFRKHGCEGQFGTVDDCWFAFADEAQAAARAALHQEGIAPK